MYNHKITNNQHPERTSNFLEIIDLTFLYLLSLVLLFALICVLKLDMIFFFWVIFCSLKTN